MGLLDTFSDGLSKFEKYNNKEIYRIGKPDSFNFVVTGRLVSGTAGFFVIIVMLILTFSSAANSYQVTDIGGIKAFTADVVVTQQTGPSLSGTLNDEGDSVTFGYLAEDESWDYITNLHLSHFEIVVDWSANGGGGGGRQVILDVSSQTNTTSESQNDGGGSGTITIPWQINSNISLNSESVSGNSDTPEAFLLSFEMDGDWMGGEFTYSGASTLSVVLAESIDYTITLFFYTWELKNIREIVEV